jgi:hypothetical protein
MFKNWEWEDSWKALGMALVIAVATTAGIFLFTTHNVDYYYLSSSSTGEASGYCVYAHWTWHGDEKAYCSDDKDKAIDFAAKATAILPHQGK